MLFNIYIYGSHQQESHPLIRFVHTYAKYLYPGTFPEDDDDGRPGGHTTTGRLENRLPVVFHLDDPGLSSRTIHLAGFSNFSSVPIPETVAESSLHRLTGVQQSTTTAAELVNSYIKSVRSAFTNNVNQSSTVLVWKGGHQRRRPGS